MERRLYSMTVPPPTLPNLNVVVEIPEVEASEPVDRREESGVGGRPLHVVHVVAVVLKRVQRAGILKRNKFCFKYLNNIFLFAVYLYSIMITLFNKRITIYRIRLN